MFCTRVRCSQGYSDVGCSAWAVGGMIEWREREGSNRKAYLKETPVGMAGFNVEGCLFFEDRQRAVRDVIADSGEA